MFNNLLGMFSEKILINRGNRKVEKDTIVLSKSESEITVFVPETTDRFIGYSFKFSNRQFKKGNKMSNVKLWSFKKAAEYNFNNNRFSIIRDFYQDSTQDLMVREEGVTDYMGGDFHGDEIMQSIEMYVDDIKLLPSDSTMVVGDKFKMIQKTFLYRDTNVTGGKLEHLATVEKEHIVNCDGYSIDVNVEFHEEITLRECLFGALSLNRFDSSGNRLFNSAVFGKHDAHENLNVVDKERKKYENVESAFILGSGVTVHWKTKRKNTIPNNSTFINKSLSTYTKLYTNYVPNGYKVKIGETFGQKTHYYFELNED